MEVFAIKAAQLILSLSILVILHELGHFIPAKLFGVRVEKFYLFFDPYFSLFKFKKGDTEYGVGWLPLGGYVKLSGMIDESMDKEQMSKPAEEWEFRAKPAWQRLIIMLGGVTVNVILGIIIYSGILYTWGESYIAAKDAEYGVTVAASAKEVGFKDGDKIISLNGNPVPSNYTYAQIAKDLLFSDVVQHVKVENAGETRTVDVPGDFDQLVMANGERGIFGERIPFIADTILPSSGAEAAGVQKGDKFVAVDGSPAEYFDEFVEAVQAKKDQDIQLTINREGELVTIPVHVSETGKIGVGNKSPLDYFNITQREYSLGEAIPAGFNMAVNTVVGYVQQFKLIFTKEGASQIGGFGSIGGMFPSVWNWQMFWQLTALLSMILAFMNVLPIPALDGGHVMFLIYEMVSGRKPGEKFLEYAQMAGMFFLLGLMIYANGNDIFKLFK